MKYRRVIYLLSLIIFFSATASSQADSISNAKEKILFNAKIFTANRTAPYAEAIAIRADKIVAVGNYNEVKNTLSQTALQVNMQGAFLMPGLIDSHEHAIEGGESLTRANTFDSLVLGEGLAAFADSVQHEGTGMVKGFLIIDGINITTWSHIPMLDSIFNNDKYKQTPVLLRGSDGHTAWGNKVIMYKAGITKKFIQSAGVLKKFFGFNADDEPNGFFADDGFSKVDSILPEFNTDWLQAGLKAIEYNNKYGITAWLEPAAGNIERKTNKILSAYKLLSDINKLSGHVSAVVVANADADAEKQVDELKALQNKYNNIINLKITGFKIFADGVVEYPTQTAALSKPYLNQPSSGVLMFQQQNFNRFVIAADKAGLLVHIHAIGDAAVTAALDGIEAARNANHNFNIPHTVTHIQFALPKDFDRFKALNVPASLQLLWAYGDVTTIDIVKPYVDASIYKWQYPARSLLQAGTFICGASDWPVSSANPFEAMYRAETRLGDLGVLDSTQCMPRIDMLYAYTINAAKALSREETTGSLEPGKSADMILIDRDALTVLPAILKNTKVLWTMFEGKIVYEMR